VRRLLLAIADERIVSRPTALWSIQNTFRELVVKGSGRASVIDPRLGTVPRPCIAELEKPSLDSIPNGRGVLVRVLRVGVDGADRETSLLIPS